MQKEQPDLKQIFSKIFSAQAAEKEKTLLARWLSKLDISGQILSFEEIEAQRLQANAKFHQRFAGQETEVKKNHFALWGPSVAAAILLLSGVALFLMPVRMAKKGVANQISFTKVGERKIIVLSDGTKVTLNNLSRIKFPLKFSPSMREIDLDGEAFFEVTHEEKRPFIVRSGKLKVQVLGTSFDVKNYSTEPRIEVTVATGKVGVVAEGHAGNWLLNPRKQLSYTRKTGAVEQTDVNPADVNGWKNGELIFKDETLQNICIKLERWYGVSVHIHGNALKSKRFSLQQKNESLSNVLSRLGISGSFNYTIENDHVNIRRKEHMD